MVRSADASVLQAISEMLPRPGEHNLAEPTEIDGKIACIGSAHGYMACAKKSVQLNAVLDAVKANLHMEQKRVMEMKFVTVHRVLSPIQVPMHAACCSQSHPCCVSHSWHSQNRHACSREHAHAHPLEKVMFRHVWHDLCMQRGLFY